MQQHRQAEGDCRQQPVEHAERNDRGHGGERDQPVALPAKVRLEDSDAQRLADRMDDDRGEDRIGYALDPRQKQQHQRQHGRGGVQAGGARLRAGRFVRRTARVACADRRPMKRARHEVRHPQRQQVAIRLHDLVVPQRKGADRTVGFRVQNEHQRQRELDHRQPLPVRRRRECRPFQGEMDGPGEPHAVGCQPRRRGDTGNDHDQNAGKTRDALEHEQAQQSADADAKAGRLPVARLAKDFAQQREQVRAVGLHRGDMRPLLHRDDQRQPE